MVFEVGGGSILRGLVPDSQEKTLPAAHSEPNEIGRDSEILGSQV